MISTAAMPLESFLETVLPLAQSEQWDSLHSECLARVRIVGEEAATLYVQGLAAYARSDIAAAASAGCRALAAGDDFAESADLVAIAHGLAGDINTALYFAKLAVSLPSREDLQAFKPADFPNFADVLAAVEEDRLVNRAKVAIGMNRLTIADNLLRQHLTFFPEDENAMVLVALCLTAQADHFEAASWLRGTIHRRPGSANLLSALASELTNIGATAEARVVHHRAAALAPGDSAIHIRQIVDLADDPATSQAELAQMAQLWGEHFQSAVTDDIQASDETPALLNVGVILSDLPGTAMGTFFAEILSRANPTEFRLVGYGFGTLTDTDNADFQRAVSDWYDLTDLDTETIGDMLRAESLDAIIDTAGFVSPLSLAALGGRCAPRQALWLNAPYDFGLKSIDGRFSDSTLDAAPVSAGLNARLIPLRHGTALAQLPAAEEPLYEAAERSQIVFGADVILRQLTAETVAWWAELLLAVPDSVLVLRDTGLSKPAAVDHMTSLFGNFGVAHRIDLIKAENDLDFWPHVDIALMPTRGAAPQEAVDILWGGIPALAPELPERNHREVSSLLRHAGLEELVAGSIPELVRIGTEWAKDGSRRKSFRTSIRTRLSASPVFDPDARAQDLWQACRELCR